MVSTHRISQLLTALNKAGFLVPCCFEFTSTIYCLLYNRQVLVVSSVWFVGALAYADDIVLMAPTATAMRQLLAVCDEFAVKFDVMFNASKSKCMLFRPRIFYSVILVILNLFDLSLSMPCFVREHDHLLVAIMHCVISMRPCEHQICLSVAIIMVALCNRADHYIFILFLLLLFCSPNLSGRRLDVYHTLAHGVALVRI